MKISTLGFFCAVGVLASTAVVTSCSKADRLAGLWQGEQQRLTDVQNVADATSVMTIDFVPGTNGAENKADFSAVIEVEQPVNALEGVDANYAVNVTAVATINATYVNEHGEDDDYILTFDPSSLQVTVDPSGVSFSENLLSGMEQPAVDSLTAATAEQWRVALTPVAREEFYKYRRIEDVEVHHADVMTLELGKTKLTFHRVAQN